MTTFLNTGATLQQLFIFDIAYYWVLTSFVFTPSENDDK